MNILKCDDKAFLLDDQGFLLDFEQWDEDFAREMAPRIKITDGLSEEHWKLIRYIRRVFVEEGRCPLIYETCRTNKLGLNDFEELFPAGYLRGLCKLAGITYKEGFIGQSMASNETENNHSSTMDKLYQVNAMGFLVNPYDWDKQFAEYKAFELKMPDHLTEEHWQIIYYLREHYRKNYAVPSIFETCKANNLTLETLERLFPDGYHRGAVKVAGLRVR